MGTIQDTDVVILCGGKGSRLKKISRGIPKAMVKIGSKPFLDILLAYLSGFGFRRFIFALGYKGGLIKSHLLGSRSHGLDFRFSWEKAPLDTGGALKKARSLIKSDYFLVLNGDSLYRIDFCKFLRFCHQRKVLAAVALKKNACGKEYGSIRLDRKGRIASFDEKNEIAKNCFINVGIYAFHKNIFSLMPGCKKFSLEKDFFQKLKHRKFFGYRSQGFFIDIGTPERLSRARGSFLKNMAL
jgi:NDP-sugar pyrophosphorylase family protein